MPALTHLRSALLLLACLLPTLLAYHRSPASTLYNQLLSLGLWAALLCVSPHAGLLRTGTPRAPLLAALGLALAAGLAMLGSHSLQDGVALVFLLAALLLLTLPARGNATELDEGLGLGLLLTGLAGLALGLVQVFLPHWADGEWIARSGFVGRAVGNVRQPNHLATLLLMAAVAWVWLGVRRQRGAREGALVLFLLVFGVVLTASRTGLWFGVPLLLLWGLLDRELPGRWRLLLLATPLMAAAAWGLLHLWASSGAGVFGAEARLDQEGAGSPSRIAILKNAWVLLQMHPWTGVGWGEFNRAWTLTPFPDRPIAFFDHTHNLPLQLLVELGWPLGLAVLGLLLATFLQALRMAWRARGADALRRRAALMLVLVVGLHSMLEYPLWYAYFLLPTALALGIALAPEVGPRVPAARWPRAAGLVLLLLCLFAYAEYQKVAAIYAPGPADEALAERVESGQRTWLFGRHADYAAATALGHDAAALAAAQRTGHQLIDARLLMAWAKSLNAQGQTDKARYLVERLREFRSREGTAWLQACELEPERWMCQPSTGRYGWRDF